MTKQEEIRDGLIKLYKDGRLTPVNVLFFMDKLGVVIKVDRELPDDVIKSFHSDMERIGKKFVGNKITYDAYEVLSNILAKEADEKLTLAGYTAWKPLIE